MVHIETKSIENRQFTSYFRHIGHVSRTHFPGMRLAISLWWPRAPRGTPKMTSETPFTISLCNIVYSVHYVSLCLAISNLNSNKYLNNLTIKTFSDIFLLNWYNSLLTIPQSFIIPFRPRSLGPTAISSKTWALFPIRFIKNESN